MERFEPYLAVDSHHGIYGPQTFAEQYGRMNISEDDWNILLDGPDNENYWETWEQVTLTWAFGPAMILESEGDIWLVDGHAAWEYRDFLLD